MDEAYKEGLVFIPETGQVPEVVIVVKGEKPVLITEGEVLVGGWQNRTVNISLLLEAGKEHRIPVSCIERGRWRPSYPRPYRQPEATQEERKEQEGFKIAAYVHHLALRMEVVDSALFAYRRANYPISDQGKVWKEVDRKLRVSRTHSPI